MKKLITSVVLAVIAAAIFSFIGGMNSSITVTPSLAAFIAGGFGLLIGQSKVFIILSVHYGNIMHSQESINQIKKKKGLIKMSQTTRISRNNTSIESDGDYNVITLHSTEIVKYNDNIIILNHGGYVTHTTVTRMMQASNQLKLGYTVHRSKGQMFVTFNGLTLPFDDNNQIVLIREQPKENRLN